MAAETGGAAPVKLEQEEKDLSHSDVITKFREAANIANETLQKVLDGIKEGVSIKSLCDLGDSLISDKSSKIYNKKENGKKVEKGIAFPTTVSVNEICYNFSPLDDSAVIAQGDIVKVHLGVHIDGYVAQAAHTVYVGLSVPPRESALILAGHTALEAALREVKIGNSSVNVSKVIEAVASEYGCNAMIGCYSYETQRNVFEGTKYLACTSKLEDKVEGFKFAQNEAYNLSVFISTGEGKLKSTETKTTIYRLDSQNRYTLKTTLGRAFISQVNSKHPFFPFHVKSCQDERALKVGLPEALRHSLVVPYAVNSERPGELVAHFRCTVLLLAGGLKKVTGLPLSQQLTCEAEIKDESLLKLLATPLAGKVKKAKEAEANNKNHAPAAEAKASIPVAAAD